MTWRNNILQYITSINTNFFVTLHYVKPKTNCTFLCAQFCASQETCCLSANFVISLQNSNRTPWSDAVILLFVIFASSPFLHVPPPQKKSSQRAWGTVTSRPDLWTKKSSLYKAVVASLNISAKCTYMLIKQYSYHIPSSCFGVLYTIFREG